MSQRSLVLAGRQITLRDWQVDDLGSYARWLAPGQRWQELDAPYAPGPRAEQIPSLVNHKRDLIMRAAWPDPRTGLVIADAATDALLGSVSWYWESRETHWILIGIALYDPASWGRGRGYEALGLWGDYLFRAMPILARLDLRTWSGNRGMMRLAAKLGYREEARFRNARIVQGQYYDALGYGVLREEWTALYPSGFAAHQAALA